MLGETEAIISMDIKKTVEKWGCCVEAAFRKGEGLLNYCQTNNPEILIIETLLDGKLDGFSTAKEILKNINIPVIFLTCNIFSEYLPQIDIGGKYEYLQKPFTMEQLKQSLQKVYPGFIPIESEFEQDV
ncbi:MAG TPA: response regulator [Ignavibacteriaceae bacterium]|nr:response regulator [Ignavibacteriaceae bacterium]